MTSPGKDEKVREDTQEDVQEDLAKDEVDEVLSTPATPGAQALPSTEVAEGE